MNVAAAVAGNATAGLKMCSYIWFSDVRKHDYIEIITNINNYNYLYLRQMQALLLFCHIL